jgi:hypothetical protein
LLSFRRRSRHNPAKIQQWIR